MSRKSRHSFFILRNEGDNIMKNSIYKTREEIPMFMTVMDMANLLGVSRASAYELAREKDFPKLKVVTGRIIIPKEKFLEWLDSQTYYGKLV